jgi:uncharacterized protein YxjI
MKKIKIDANVMKLIIISSIIFILIGKLVLNLVLTETGEKTNYSKDEVFEILQNAEEIRICKNYRTIFKKDYSIIVNGEQVAVVQGEVVKMLGDTFTMYSSNGEKICYEKEEVLHLNRQAQFYDANGNKRGRLHSKFFTLFNKDEFYDNSGNKIARCDEQLAIPAEYIIHDTNGNELYYIEKDLFFDNYTLIIKDNEKLDVVDAILISCIQDAVAGDSDNNNNSSSKKD